MHQFGDDKPQEEIRYKKIKPCWACGIPSNCDVHHVVPSHLGGSDDNTNLIYLCEPCHSIIDRRRFQNYGDLSWFMKEASKNEGPRWARLMLLELTKFLTFFKNRYGVDLNNFNANPDLISINDALMIQFLGAVSHFERHILKEMIKAGLKNEKMPGYSRYGKRLGAKKKEIDETLVKKMHSEGKSLRYIAKSIGVSFETIRRILLREKATQVKKYEFSSDPE